MHSIYIKYTSHKRLSRLSKAGAALVNTISSIIGISITEKNPISASKKLGQFVFEIASQLMAVTMICVLEGLSGI